jgi:cyclopropane fatty-acyl-phospholipid synthase-like methyltransferase
LDHKQLVEQGYDRMAESYLAARVNNTSLMLAQLERLATALPEDAQVLDLGCGAGVPSVTFLAERFSVTGVDSSARQLELARQHSPAAHFIKNDMTTVSFPVCTFDAVVAFYSIIHVPREEHLALLGRIHSWLKPGGRFMATWPFGAWEGTESNWEGWGSTMWWSHYGWGEYEVLLTDAGFSVESMEEQHDSEDWLWVSARKH